MGCEVPSRSYLRAYPLRRYRGVVLMQGEEPLSFIDRQGTSWTLKFRVLRLLSH